MAEMLGADVSVRCRIICITGVRECRAIVRRSMRLPIIFFGTALATCAIPVSTRAQSPACIALTLPSVQGAEDPANFGTGVRDLFVSYLTGPSIKAITLEARLPSQAALEARQKECGQVLLTSVTRKHSESKAAGILGQAAGSAVMRTPLGGGVTGALASGATSAGGEAIYRFSSQVRAKDEIELSYRFGTPDAVEAAKPVTAKAKAKTDGEDVLTPLVEKAASAIVGRLR